MFSCCTSASFIIYYCTAFITLAPATNAPLFSTDWRRWAQEYKTLVTTEWSECPNDKIEAQTHLLCLRGDLRWWLYSRPASRSASRAWTSPALATAAAWSSSPSAAALASPGSGKWPHLFSMKNGLTCLEWKMASLVQYEKWAYIYRMKLLTYPGTDVINKL